MFTLRLVHQIVLRTCCYSSFICSYLSQCDMTRRCFCCLRCFYSSNAANDIATCRRVMHFLAILNWIIFFLPFFKAFVTVHHQRSVGRGICFWSEFLFGQVMDDSLYLPDVVLIQIFGYLNAEVSSWVLVLESIWLIVFIIFFCLFGVFIQEILKCSSVCKAWLRVTQDELLWRTLVRRDWKLNPRVSIAPG